MVISALPLEVSGSRVVKISDVSLDEVEAWPLYASKPSVGLGGLDKAGTQNPG